MDKKDYKIKEYHEMVRGEAKKEIENYFLSDPRAWLGSILIGIVSSISTSYFLERWNSDAMVNIFVQIIGIAFGLILGLSVFVIVLYGWDIFWVIPAKLFREQEEKAYRYSWDGVEIKVGSPPENGIHMAFLGVVNRKAFDITNVSASIVYVLKDNFMINNLSSSKFRWLSRINEDNPYSNRILLKGEVDAVVFAWWVSKEESPILTVDISEDENKPDEVKLDMNSKYVITIAFEGKIQGKEIGKLEKNYLLIFDGNKLLLQDAK